MENKKILPADLVNLNTSNIDANWSMILQSYSFLVYGIGQVTEPKNLLKVTGVSMYPWLKEKMNVDIVKKTVSMIE